MLDGTRSERRRTYAKTFSRNMHEHQTSSPFFLIPLQFAIILLAASGEVVEDFSEYRAAVKCYPFSRGLRDPVWDVLHFYHSIRFEAFNIQLLQANSRLASRVVLISAHSMSIYDFFATD